MSIKLDWKYPEKGELPEEGKYVLIYVPSRPWSDKDDQDGIFYKVAKLSKGISEKERQLLPNNSKRKIQYTSADEFGNNLVPYHWYEFGSGSYFGQEVEKWAYFK